VNASRRDGVVAVRRRPGWLLAAVVVVVGACTLSGRALRWRPPAEGPAWRGVVVVGALGPEVPESSGLTPSARQPGLYWTLNDSGNEPEVVAIDVRGATRARVRLDGVENEDWEALGMGPCPSGTCLVVGDVGDNMARRPVVRLLRFPEPALPAPPGEAMRVQREVELLRFRFPDGPRDVEALYVAPDGAVWLITKRPAWWALRARPARLYRLPAAAWRAPGAAPVVAEAAGVLPVYPGRRNAREWVTDAALSGVQRDGGRLLAVLTYGTIHLFRADPVTGRPGARVARCPLPLPEHDPEAIAWRPDGSLMVTNEGERSTVYAGWCP
jgi:hypothetical protein